MSKWQTKFISGKGKKKITTAERWKRKKESKEPMEEDPNSVSITKLTELANELLTRTGNMDIYQETYEQIKKKVIAYNCITYTHLVVLLQEIIFCRLTKRTSTRHLQSKKQN